MKEVVLAKVNVRTTSEDGTARSFVSLEQD